MGFKNYYQKEIERYGGEKNYILAKAKEKKILLDLIKKYARNKRVLEAGCGSSVNSIYLASKGFKVTAIDNDEKILNLAKDIAQKMDLFINYQKLNIFDVKGKFSIVFSHGVLEHFNDTEIIKLLNKELKIGEIVIVSIPSDFFKQSQAINGDERFLSREKWRFLIKQSGGKILEEFSYFYDPDNFKLRILKFMSKLTKGLFPRKKPYIGFVIKKCL